MIKIAIITPSLSGGGAEKIAINLANQWSKNGYLIDLITLKKSYDYKRLLYEYFNLHKVNASEVRYSILKLRNLLSEIQPEFVLSVMRSSNIAVALSYLGISHKPKLIFREASTFHGVLEKNIIVKPFFIQLMKYSYRKAYQIIANSPDTLSDLRRNKIINHYTGCMIPNPVLPDDYEVLADKKINHPWLDDPGLKVVLSVSRLHPNKNLEFLIRSFSELHNKQPNTRLIIVGKGSEKNYLSNLCRELKISDFVRFEGFKLNPFPYYKMADVFALTSKWEGFGNVIVESLSVGTPVVVCNCSGGPSFILNNGEFGRLVPVEDITRFTSALHEALYNPIDKKKLIKRADEFTVSSISQKYLQAMGLLC